MGIVEQLGALDFKAVDTVVYHYLNTLNSWGWAGYLAHMTLMLAGEVFENEFLPAGAAGPWVDAVNKAYEAVRDPNIDGIIIRASKESSSRDVDVSQKLLLRLQDSSKEYAIDNSVPHLRQWKIEGYITSSSILGRGLTVKPDLLYKLTLLDSFSKSRLPVLFKSSDMRFNKVLISHYDYEYDPKATNAAHVNITLQEFKTVDINVGSPTSIINALRRK